MQNDCDEMGTNRSRMNYFSFVTKKIEIFSKSFFIQIYASCKISCVETFVVWLPCALYIMAKQRPISMMMIDYFCFIPFPRFFSFALSSKYDIRADTAHRMPDTHRIERERKVRMRVLLCSLATYVTEDWSTIATNE